MSLDSTSDVGVAIGFRTPLTNMSSASTTDSVVHTLKLKLSHSLKTAFSRTFEAEELELDNQLSENLSIAKGLVSSMAASCI